MEYTDTLGDDLNHFLSFEHLKERDTTKHVHRLHPYKGKFIPQLVEYFLDQHTDQYKKETYFQAGDIILDPFSGSGTTMVQASEMGINVVGVDVSIFNQLISNVKLYNVPFDILTTELGKITRGLKKFISRSNNIQFDKSISEELNIFNKHHFTTPEFKQKLRNNEINIKEYGKIKQEEFNIIFDRLLEHYNLKMTQDKTDTFIDKWYIEPVRREIDYIFEQLKYISNDIVRNIITIILSRTIRSCRATTHSDLGSLVKPVMTPYYCRKHKKICKPLLSTLSWWERYCKDTIQRFKEFEKLKTDTFQICLRGDSRNIDIISELNKVDKNVSEMVQNKKIKGIFSSPPYIGVIDYHEQHAYSYDLFGFERNDILEIGPLYKGQGKQAKKSYIDGMVDVLNNSKQYLQEDFDVFLVANDKYNMYPEIAQKSGMKIVNQYNRPVLNRTENSKNTYSETIFHLKNIKH